MENIYETCLFIKVIMARSFQKYLRSSAKITDYCVNVEMIELDKLLPSDLCIESIDTILYDIGLSIEQTIGENQTQRKFYNNPLFIHLYNSTNCHPSSNQ
jgi:hypothetical protein